MKEGRMEGAGEGEKRENGYGRREGKQRDSRKKKIARC